jgi:uncharacterized protein
MILLVMADSHNNLRGIQSALATGRQCGARTALHCGDLTSESMLEAFAGWTLYLAMGNMDRNPASLGARVARLGNQSECREEIHLQVDGLRITMVHGDRSSQLSARMHQADQDFLFHGHTHRLRDTMIGQVRVINPGALGGVVTEPLSFCILDTSRRKVDFFQLEDHSHCPD